MRARLHKSLASAVCRGIIVLACSALLIPDAVARPLDDVKASGFLRVIVYDDNAPFSWTEADGTIKGIDADIARAIAASMGLKPELIARIAGEEVDDDLRSNIWQGPRTGGPVGDVMMHVPMEKEFIARNNLVQISNAYYHEQTVLVLHPDLADPAKGFAAFENAKLAVHFATTAHYYAMFVDEGRYKTSISPYVKFASAVDAFLKRQSAGLLGRRSEIEAALHDKDAKAVTIEPTFNTYMRMAWTIGTAVKHDSRDTGYAVGNALAEIEKSGELARIFRSYGLSYVAPPVQ
ncbi:MAG: substrate-binding periplasmic protein [Hyphomicrobiaceae bacterium]